MVIATHDPAPALSAHRRLIFENAALRAVLTRTEAEERLLVSLTEQEAEFSWLREKLRRGEAVCL